MSGVAGIALFGVMSGAIVPMISIAVASAVGVSSVNVFRMTADRVINRIDRERLEKISGSIGGYSVDISRAGSGIMKEYDKAARQCSSDLEAVFSEIKEKYSAEADLESFADDCSAARNRIFLELQNRLDAADKVYNETLETELMRIDRLLADERKELTQGLDELREREEEYLEKASLAAEKAIEKAENVVSGLSDTYGASAGRYCDGLRIVLSSAVENMKKGSYETAVICAYSVISRALATSSELLREEKRSAVLYAYCSSLSEQLKQYMESFSSVSYEMEETASGESKTVEVSDFTVFFGEKWAELESIGNVCREKLAAADSSGFVAEELIDIRAMLEKANTDFLKELSKAYERLHNNLARNEYADIISSAYEEMGYEEISPGEYEPLEKTVMMFRSADGTEQVRVTLRPEHDSSGKTGIAIDVECHDENAADELTEDRRNACRESICESIMNSTPGKRNGVRAEQSCKRGTQNKNAF